MEHSVGITCLLVLALSRKSVSATGNSAIFDTSVTERGYETIGFYRAVSTVTCYLKCSNDLECNRVAWLVEDNLCIVINLTNEVNDQEQLIQTQSVIHHPPEILQRISFLKGYGILAENLACFGGKGGDYGSFIHSNPTGKYWIALVHKYGGISCNAAYAKSPFGCMHAAYLRLMTILTNHQNGDPHVLAIADDNGPMAEIVKTTTSVNLINGNTYRIWYEEDLHNRNEGNNSGQSCFAVQLKPE